MLRCDVMWWGEDKCDVMSVCWAVAQCDMVERNVLWSDLLI